MLIFSILCAFRRNHTGCMSGSVRAERSETDCTLVQPHRGEGLRPKSIPLGGDTSGYDLRLSRHDALFRVACVLVNGSALSDTEICSILVEYNAAACRLGVNAACVELSEAPQGKALRARWPSNRRRLEPAPPTLCLMECPAFWVASHCERGIRRARRI